MLDPDWTTILFEVVNFIVLVVLLNRFLFKPVMVRVRQQAADKAKLQAEMESQLVDTQRLRVELEARLAAAQVEADALVEEGRISAETERNTLLQNAHQQADDILRSAHAEGEQFKKNIATLYENQLVDTVIQVSRSVLHNAASADQHDILVQQLNDEIWHLGQNDLSRVQSVRQSLGEREPTVDVCTARPLTIAQQGLLARTFTALADHDIDLRINIDPSLGAGLRVRIGDLMVENCLSDQLDVLRDDVKQSLSTRLISSPP